MFAPSGVVAVVIRPWLWGAAIGAVFAFAKRDWWKRWPFLPVPDPAVMQWRVTTAYGRPDMTLADADLLSYLRWRRRARTNTSA